MTTQTGVYRHLYLAVHMLGFVGKGNVRLVYMVVTAVAVDTGGMRAARRVTVTLAAARAAQVGRVSPGRIRSRTLRDSTGILYTGMTVGVIAYPEWCAGVGRRHGSGGSTADYAGVIRQGTPGQFGRNTGHMPETVDRGRYNMTLITGDGCRIIMSTGQMRNMGPDV